MATPREAPEGQLLAKVEDPLKSLVWEMGELKADLRRLKAKVNRYFFWTIGIFLGVTIPMWVSLMVAIFVIW